jgi:serine protease
MEKEYSGFIIIRLRPGLKDEGFQSLTDLTAELGLQELQEILEQYDWAATSRLVRSLPVDDIHKLEAEAEDTSFPPLRSLTSYWRMDLRKDWDQASEILERLNATEDVDLAYREGLATDPVVNDADDPHATLQDYLDAAPTGINARWAWTQPHGEGAGVGVIDLEMGWIPTHEDLRDKTPTLIHGDNAHNILVLPDGSIYEGHHGTAVLGEMIATDNTVGVVGIAASCTSVRMASHYDAATDSTGHVADAITSILPVMPAGDVLLLEIQKDYWPTETDDADFDAIRLAVAHGIIVVEAAGNRGSDLDAYTNAAGDHILDRTHADFRDSGAIMVGAALSPLPHNRKAASNYGSRIDCYGWGEDVVTCGYGDLAGTNNDNYYHDDFRNTSAASPIVAGAALVLQGHYEGELGVRLSPIQMRTLLSDPATGTAQGGGVAGNIGVMPDLQALMNNLGLVPDVYVRDNVGDTGTIPSVGALASSPDVFVLHAPVGDPNASFGEGSVHEDDTGLGSLVERGHSNFVYVRMKNRGEGDANAVQATVYYSTPATLLTPDLWTAIGTTPPVNVPHGDTLVVADPIEWLDADLPPDGHYCFVAILDHPQDPAPLPPGPTDWAGYQSFIRAQNNVTWRNFNVETPPDPAGDPADLPFLLNGYPDEPRYFNLEILRFLPKDAELWLEVPVELGKLLLERIWPPEVKETDDGLLLLLPPARKLLVPEVRLGGKELNRCRFLVRAVEGMEKGGHAVTIRQLYRDQEVGRITWTFQWPRKFE